MSLFATRTQKSIKKCLISLCWQEIGWRRAARYWMVRLQRITASSEQIASGVATGITVSFLPVLGVYVLMAVAIAAITGGHVAAAVIALIIMIFIWVRMYVLMRSILKTYKQGRR